MKANPDYPYGNAIYGADFKQDENGNIIIESISVDEPVLGNPAEGTEARTETVTHYYVTPVIYNIDIYPVAEVALGFKMPDIYDPENDEKSTYADTISAMSLTIGSMLYGDDFWLQGGVYWPGSIGIPNDSIAATALSQLGNVGGRPYWSWYGFKSPVAWCACFVSWCANEGGYIEDGTIPRFSSCTVGMDWFQDKSQYASRSSGYKPKAGDIIFFDWADNGRTGRPDHVGIVTGSDATSVYTIEGNSGNRCKSKVYYLTSLDILGYGVPNYS